MNQSGYSNARRPKTAIFITFLLINFLGGCLTEDQGTTAESGSSGTVAPGGDNHAPTIAGNPPPAAMVGEAYYFAPDASDPDGDDLTFSIEGKPGWAAFDGATGSLSGIPTTADVGVVTGIRISVSDSQATVSMPDFSVEVVETAPGSTTLSWMAPTDNEDGTALTDLAGYKLFYGRTSGKYTNVIRIDNPSVTTYVVDNLVPATYYFAATAYNAAGTESAFSDEAVRLVN